MWREVRYRTLFHCTHEEYLNESFQRSIIMVELAEMEADLKNGE